MKWIDSSDLMNWANRRDCQETLPYLVRKLIRATSNSIQSIKFPSGDNILIGGWDGILEVSEETEYIPKGISLWEFGANKDIKSKADDDYLKRTKNPLGFNPAESTFVFVTPRHWQKGDDWVKEKIIDGLWKNIKVISVETLEEWIEVAPTVGSWLAKHIGKYPEGGIQPTDDFWVEWISGQKYNLNPEVLLGGRKKEQEKIIELARQPAIIAVQGISREEALGFIISCFKSNYELEEDFFSRSIIVDNAVAFRELSVHDKPLILIPRFEDDGVLNRAVIAGHTVIVPLGADSSINWNNKIILPQIEREAFVIALVKMGMSRELAERYSKESTRNITILRRQLEFTRALPNWALPESVMDIIPSLIVGRWDENYENDRITIATIANDSYENYCKKLNKWRYRADSPIVKIGSTWRLTSPFDAWTNASRYLTRHDFECLSKFVNEIITEINPAFELQPEQRQMASIFGKNRKYSEWIREGIIQSLILTSILGDKLQFDLTLKSELWVDNVIAKLLSTEDPLLWKSFEGMLPLIAEASPISFLNSIEKYLNIEKSPIFSLFEEDPGYISPKSYHTGLLWALENLVWFPNYLSRASLILSKLASIDPGGRISNRPINSLSEIFKPWHCQTLASYEERMQVLKLITEREPQIAWNLFILMLPESHGGVAFPIHKTRWRMFDMESEKSITYKEIYDTYSTIVDFLILLFDFTESKLSRLIEESVKLSPTDRNKILLFIETIYTNVKQSNYSAWNSTRKILYHHRSYPKAPWALSEMELIRFDNLYRKLIPTDIIEKTIWLFNEHWPEFFEGYQHQDFPDNKQENLIHERRVEGLISIYQKFGLEKIINLSQKVKEGSILGDTLGYIVNKEEELIRLCGILAEENPEIHFIASFLFRKSVLNGLDWIFSLFEKLKQIGFTNKTLAKVFVPLIQNKQLWDFIESTNEEITREYWINIFPRFYGITLDEKVYGIKKLIEHKRFLSAIHICSHIEEEVPSELIVEILEKAGTEKSEERVRLDGYEINRLFERLDKKNDVNASILLKLEWLFLPLLASFDNQRKPIRLHEELSLNPKFFMEVLKLIYKPEDETKIEEEKNDLTDDQIQNKAQHAFDLLHSWKKIPGVNQTGDIDFEFLKCWIYKLRELALDYGRIGEADIFIGQVLAQYPENPKILWPPDEICTLIEDLSSEDINRNFSMTIFNNRGSSTRGLFDGGYIEKEKAGYFHKLAVTHQNRFPSVAKIFENLAIGYEQDSKRMDIRAELDQFEY